MNLGLHVGDLDAAVVENRARTAAAFSCELDELVFMDQVHGSRVAIVDEAAAGRGARVVDHAIAATDALVTSTPQLPLVVLVADCSPILLADPGAGVLCLVHAGWRGVAGGVVEAAISAMLTLGATTSELIAFVGPSIEQERFEVGEEVVDALRARLGEGIESQVDRSEPRPLVDLAGANIASMLAAGVPADSITRFDTGTSDERFFSDRSARPCGRYGLLARLAPRSPVASEAP